MRESNEHRGNREDASDQAPAVRPKHELQSHSHQVEQEREGVDILTRDHEVVEMFRESGFPLNWELVGMLNEDEEHQGGRRGSGFTQASRHLAEYIRADRRIPTLSVFDEQLRADIEDRLYEEGGYDLLERTPTYTQVDFSKINDIVDQFQSPGSKLIGNMIADLCKARTLDDSILKPPVLKEKFFIGTCTAAELYFYDYLNPLSLRKGDGEMNAIVDENNTPVFLEKVGRGNDHSALSLRDLNIHDVFIPAGSLFAIQYGDVAKDTQTASGQGSILQLSDIDGVEFLRVTPLVVSPKDRQDVFGSHLQYQKDNLMYHSETITIEDFQKRMFWEVGSDSLNK